MWGCSGRGVLGDGNAKRSVTPARRSGRHVATTEVFLVRPIYKCCLWCLYFSSQSQLRICVFAQGCFGWRDGCDERFCKRKEAQTFMVPMYRLLAGPGSYSVHDGCVGRGSCRFGFARGAQPTVVLPSTISTYAGSVPAPAAVGAGKLCNGGGTPGTGNVLPVATDAVNDGCPAAQAIFSADNRGGVATDPQGNVVCARWR